MCTRAVWTPGERVLAGRNMDWLEDMRSNLWAFPAGVARDGLVPGGVTWTSQYGSVVISCYDMTSADGVNEAGLGAHVLWLAEADYGERDPARPGLALSLWAQHFLDRFATVAEAIDFLDDTPLQPVAQDDPNTKRPTTVHLALEDATGDSAVIECIDGETRVHHDPAYTVVTNSPPFDQQLENLSQYQGFGGDAPLPGTTQATDRFVRASYYVERLPEPASARQAVAEILSVMRNSAQPFGTVDPARPNISSTIWRTVIDFTNGYYFFESSFSPNIVWVRVRDLDLSPGQPARVVRLSGADGDLVGDVTDRFEAAEPFAFLPAG